MRKLIFNALTSFCIGILMVAIGGCEPDSKYKTMYVECREQSETDKTNCNNDIARLKEEKASIVSCDDIEESEEDVVYKVSCDYMEDDIFTTYPPEYEDGIWYIFTKDEEIETNGTCVVSSPMDVDW